LTNQVVVDQARAAVEEQRLRAREGDVAAAEARQVAADRRVVAAAGQLEALRAAAVYSLCHHLIGLEVYILRYIPYAAV
jgi:hypothetical protein